jgi:hypothetical protein
MVVDEHAMRLTGDERRFVGGVPDHQLDWRDRPSVGEAYERRA